MIDLVVLDGKWNELTQIFIQNEENTISYLNRCSKEKIYWISEVFIGPQSETYVYEVYDFNIISVKRLYESFQDYGIMLNKGWLITQYYDNSNKKKRGDKL